MNKMFLIKNPELFQGEKYLKSTKNYFEGWYFKNINNEDGISFIPGINIDEKEKSAFIQVITNASSYFIKFNINEFKFNHHPFCINIGNNSFSKNNIHIDIKDNSQNLKIKGDIKFSNSKNIETNSLNPNIMGPFSYMPFMECNHAILSMKNKVQGTINMNNQIIDMSNGIGYIEKDWGCSFPKQYIWCQANNFSNANSSFMLAIADIPFGIINFRGIICSLIIDNKEYRFATYNNTKITKYDILNGYVEIDFKRKQYSLNIKINYNQRNKLSAPVKGKMSKAIYENISSIVTIILKKGDDIIFKDTSKNCGLEIVK